MLKLSYSRLKDILMIIVLSKVEVSSNVLAKRLKVSSRTIRSDINKLNSEISDYKVIIENHRGKGYSIQALSEDKFHELKSDLNILEGQTSLDTMNDRMKHLLSMLLCEGENISIDDALNDLFISINTFNNYIVEIKQIIDRYNLKIARKYNKISLIGSEENKRHCLIEQLENRHYDGYVLGFTENERKLFRNIDLDIVGEKVNEFIDESIKNIPDYNLKNIVIHMAIVLSRIKSHYVLAKFDSEVVVSNELQNALNKLFDDFEKIFNEKIPNSEREYIKYHIALNNPEIIRNLNTYQSDSIEKSVILFLDKIQANYTFNLSNDNALIENLTEHIKSFVKINNLDYSRKNPLLDVILSTFPLAYEMTVTSIDILEKKLHIQLSKDELSFITLHVGASMERNYNNKWKKRNVAIICGSGTTTANLLKIKLESRFSSYLNIMGIYSYADYKSKNYPKNTDFFISTVPILNSELPVVQVDLANYANDSKELYDFITSTSTEQQVLYHLFNPNLIFIDSKLNTREDVLNFLCDKLEKQEIVQSDFRKKVFERERLYSTAIGGEIAIPHPIKFASKQSAVAFMRLKQPICWDENGDKIQLIFLLAINEQEYPKVQTLFSFLVNLQTDIQFNDEIGKCKNPWETINVINSLIQNNTKIL